MQRALGTHPSSEWEAATGRSRQDPGCPRAGLPFWAGPENAGQMEDSGTELPSWASKCPTRDENLGSEAGVGKGWSWREGREVQSKEAGGPHPDGRVQEEEHP